MKLRSLRPTNPRSRHAILDVFEEVTSTNPQKNLLQSIRVTSGRNARGVITSHHRCGGHKRLYRKIDFSRTKLGLPRYVDRIQYDPYRNARIALLRYADGVNSYILAPKGLVAGRVVVASFFSPIQVGNSLPLWKIPLGTIVHNVEFRPGAGGQLARASGVSLQIVARENGFAVLRLPSGEFRLIPQFCWATVGCVSASNSRNKNLGKAGRIVWAGWRPRVRGRVMNPIDHPHGGGEGRCPIGRSAPVTSSGNLRLSVKTRRPKKYSDTLILRRTGLVELILFLI